MKSCSRHLAYWESNNSSHFRETRNAFYSLVSAKVFDAFYVSKATKVKDGLSRPAVFRSAEEQATRLQKLEEDFPTGVWSEASTRVIETQA